MQIIIVGDGKVGVALTEQLSSEGHDITVIDSNPKVLEQSLESYDVMVVHGNGASIGVLKEAGVEDAHLLIAATSRDETNLLTSWQKSWAQSTPLPGCATPNMPSSWC